MSSCTASDDGHPHASIETARTAQSAVPAWSQLSRTPDRDAFSDWLDWYNYHRPHTGINGRIPPSRVTNLS